MEHEFDPEIRECVDDGAAVVGVDSDGDILIKGPLVYLCFPADQVYAALKEYFEG